MANGPILDIGVTAMVFIVCMNGDSVASFDCESEAWIYVYRELSDMSDVTVIPVNVASVDHTESV